MGVTVVVTGVTSVKGSPSAVLLRSSVISYDEVFSYWLLSSCNAVTSVTMRVVGFLDVVTISELLVTSVTTTVWAI